MIWQYSVLILFISKIIDDAFDSTISAAQPAVWWSITDSNLHVSTVAFVVWGSVTVSELPISTVLDVVVGAVTGSELLVDTVVVAVTINEKDTQLIFH